MKTLALSFLSASRRSVFSRSLILVGGLFGAVLAAGCATTGSPSASPLPTGKPAEVFTLQEGDVLKFAFPGAPSLDSTQPVRRDGKVTLGMVGEVAVVGKTPTELEQELLKLYATQLVSNEVRVLVVSSSFPVFVSGAVLRPGKILADRPLTALEAIMEAGGYDAARANLRAVQIVRQEEGGTRNYTLDLKQVLDGKSVEPFYLRRSDIVIVPERFSWF